MKVLAIEISSAEGSVAVTENGRLIEERHFPCERGRGAEIFAVLGELREAWRDLDTIAVGIGPGSYNGLRTACALATSLQMSSSATLRVAPSPCLLPTDALHYCVCGDARGGRAYRAEVRNRRLVGDIVLVGYDEAVALGDGSVPAFRVGLLPGGGRMPSLAPDAATLALLAPDLPAERTAQVQPIYLKPPHITQPPDRGT